MFRNYIKIAWRNALKNKSFTFISLISLVLGISLFFIISIWVQDELSYDTGYNHPEYIYRIESSLTLPDGGESVLQTVGWPVGKSIEENFAEVESLTYMRNWSPVISLKDAKYYEDALLADENFFKVFGYELEEGSEEDALTDPRSLVLTSALKQKFFGNANALGEILMLNDTIPYKITGILKPLDKPSHLKFGLLGSFSTICSSQPQFCADQYASGWFDVNVYNYLRIKPGVDEVGLAIKVENVVKTFGREAVEASGYSTSLNMRPVTDVYLKSGLPTGKGTIGNIDSVRLFLGIAIFILLLACLNFINLSTASSMERAKEIGIKKVLGSNRKTLIKQFLTEAAFLCFIAAVISVVLVLLCLPYFNQFSGKTFTIGEIFSLKRLIILISIFVLLIPLAGFYPAWVMSSFRPIKVLKGHFAHSISGNTFRKGLVVFQFVVSIAFIMGSIVISQQLDYMQNQNLGFDKDHIMLVDASKVPWDMRQNKTEILKKTLLAQKGFTSVSAATAIPGRTGWDSQFAYPEGKPKDEGIIVEYIPVDTEYLKTLGLELAAGRDFLSDSQLDAEQSLIINEAAVKTFGWDSNENAIGKKLTTSGKEGQVVGVVKDYHQHGLQSRINPLVFGIAPYINLYAVKYNDLKPKQAIDNLTAVWSNIFKDYPLEYSFMDEVLQKQYEKEQKLGSIFKIATFLSILIACLGLFGLSIYTAQKRIKEIGVRKVLGATVSNIVLLLSTDFLKLVLIAILISAPIAWYSMNNWLEDFAYRINMQWWVFVLSGIGALLIAFLTIGFQSIKAAITNPTQNLRTE